MQIQTPEAMAAETSVQAGIKAYSLTTECRTVMKRVAQGEPVIIKGLIF
jgi:hypothetical protein